MSNTSNLRKILWKEMNDLKSGKSDIKKSRQFTKIASQIIYSLRVDIENKRENIKIMKATKKKNYKEHEAKSLKIF